MMTFENHFLFDDSTSRSVPGSRRNSNDEKNLTPDPIDFFMKFPSRSFSIDVGSIYNNDSSLFLDDKQGPLFRSNHYNLRTNYSSHYELFAKSTPTTIHSGSDLDFENYSFQSNSVTKSWIPFLDNYQQDVHNASRFSFGWTNNPTSKPAIEDYKGKLIDLCKDQNGCRFLQTKLEESALNVNVIFEEIYVYFVDLMIDPFGNYLAQKLLEKCNDLQRTQIVHVIRPEFLKICTSMHGTRAIQKLIEFLSTTQQIHAVIPALKPNVVALIKDLNGNHVIQKCLNKFSSEHNQFIYDIVSDHCIQVATHKHGCCVYQRCFDFATPAQKAQLVRVITKNALPLVQDPFGNYVVQYVLGLNDPAYYRELICKFIEPVCELSIQKFSSNVIEKCIRVADKDTKRKLISGMMNHPNMDRFLRDSYANYVIQTCLDCAEPDQRNQFIECIRPLLPSIRHTPYGKRIYSKINPVRSSHRSQ